MSTQTGYGEGNSLEDDVGEAQLEVVGRDTSVDWVGDMKRRRHDRRHTLRRKWDWRLAPYNGNKVMHCCDI